MANPRKRKLRRAARLKKWLENNQPTVVEETTDTAAEPESASDPKPEPVLELKKKTAAKKPVAKKPVAKKTAEKKPATKSDKE